MTISMLDLSRVHRPLEAELKAAFERVLHANSYILGKEVSNFEAACATYLGVKHAIGVSSGSDALLLALMVHDIGPGDEVICPSYTFFATAGAVARLGAKPVFVDCDPQTYNWNLEQVFAAASERTRAVIPVHLFGLCAPLDGLMEWANQRNVLVIEDVAQSMGSMGSTETGQMAGSVGHFGCFSFFPSKNLGGFGDGGLLITHDDALAEKARVLRTHGAKPKYHHHFVGGNFRLDALQAALLSVKLPHLETWITQRQQVAQHYDQLFRSAGTDIQLPVETAHSRHTFNQYIIRLSEPELRNRLQSGLTAQGIGTAVYYPVPLHLQACFAGHGALPAGALPESEAAALTTLALPMDPTLTPAEQAQIVSAALALTGGVTHGRA